MRVHFIGIGGIGLSALARFLQYRGYEVSGSDIRSTPITEELKKEGIKVNIPQSSENIDGHDLVIYSAAVQNDNVEIIEAKKQELLLLPRKEALSVIMQKTVNYCVCAAHGKSTTTAILSAILQSSAIIGAISKEFGSNFRYIDDVLAFEADESDESFILSHPYCSIVLNTEPEHMEFVDNANKNFDCFHGPAEKSWSKKDLNNAYIQKRPVVHLPIVAPMISLVQGMQMQNPIEIRCFAGTLRARARPGDASRGGPLTELV